MEQAIPALVAWLTVTFITVYKFILTGEQKPCTRCSVLHLIFGGLVASVVLTLSLSSLSGFSCPGRQHGASHVYHTVLTSGFLKPNEHVYICSIGWGLLCQSSYLSWFQVTQVSAKRCNIPEHLAAWDYESMPASCCLGPHTEPEIFFMQIDSVPGSNFLARFSSNVLSVHSWLRVSPVDTYFHIEITYFINEHAFL